MQEGDTIALCTHFRRSKAVVKETSGFKMGMNKSKLKVRRCY